MLAQFYIFNNTIGSVDCYTTAYVIEKLLYVLCFMNKLNEFHMYPQREYGFGKSEP